MHTNEAGDHNLPGGGAGDPPLGGDAPRGGPRKRKVDVLYASESYVAVNKPFDTRRDPCGTQSLEAAPPFPGALLLFRRRFLDARRGPDPCETAYLGG